MTNFTDDQIEAVEDAIDAVNAKSTDITVTNPADVILELQKPKPVFGDDLVYSSVRGWVIWRTEYTAIPNETLRRPTPSEVPALALAIERLELICAPHRSRATPTTEVIICIAQAALDEIKKLNET